MYVLFIDEDILFMYIGWVSGKQTNGYKICCLAKS